MEAFLAVIRLNHEKKVRAKLLAQEGITQVKAPDTFIRCFDDEQMGFAITIQIRRFASDTFVGQVEPRLFYIQGCVESLNGGSHPEANHPFAPDKIVPRDLFSTSTRLRDLTGSYHIVVYDFQEKMLRLIVDRSASRPIYYYQDATCAIFSSDIRAILGTPGVDRHLDLAGLAQFVRIQMVFGNGTLYRNIRTIAPGTMHSYDLRGGSSCESRYWTMEPLEPFRNEGEAVEGLADAFLRAGKRIVRGGTRNGILLSGGIDSRMTLASFPQVNRQLEAFTFGPALTDEGEIACKVARASKLSWHLVTQSPEEYWENLENTLPALQAQYSMAHAHTAKTVSEMTFKGVDTVYDGWGLDLFFSGSYLPRLDPIVWGRKLFINKLSPVNDQESVIIAIFSTLDVQEGEFARSYLSDSLQALWESAFLEVVQRQVSKISGTWASSYDHLEKFFACDISKFRSYPLSSFARRYTRQRNPLFDSDVFDVYLRLPVESRFMGRIYRRALRRMNPQLAEIPCSNTGTSLSTSPIAEGLFRTGRQFHRANRNRAARMLRTIGLHHVMDVKIYGSYPSPVELVWLLGKGKIPQAATTKKALINGFLADKGIVDTSRLKARLDNPMGMAKNEAWTILALASLAAWFERYPAEV